MSKLRVLIACEFSGVVRNAFRALGFEAREIEGSPGYMVTACGRIFSRNHATGHLAYFKELSAAKDAKGYFGLTLCNAAGHTKKRVHRIVAEAFHPNPDSLPCVRHLNSDPSDNSASNLAWGTYADNEADKIGNGTWHSRQTGKLTGIQIDYARQCAADGVSQTKIAELVGVSRPTITRLLNGSTWGNIPCAS